MSILDLARPEIRGLQAYSSARTEAAMAEVMLNANESAWPPAGVPMPLHGRSLNRYPDPQPRDLLARLAELYSVDESRILMGRGSDEAIDLLIRAFRRPGMDAIAIAPPTFGMYSVCAAIQGAKCIQVPLDRRFELDVDVLLEKLPASLKVVFLCSPNNPTGGLISHASIGRIATALHERALVIVDEAYIEFANAPSATVLLGRHENLGILRTLSKAWGLAGARVGCLLADSEVISLLRRIMPPYPLPTPSIVAALAALNAEGLELTRQRIGLVVSERERLAAALVRLPSVVEVLPSQANFLCVRFDDAARVQRSLQRDGVIVRDVGRHPRLEGYLRITVGSREENSRLLEALVRQEVSG
ncbi:histidinol-phosphate transaminase [Dokdonella sp.]|uniref:histidinol-phosphate transaminase n=1 Tax=Dokdonella sp. TaxID=2291710 RepID=UPI00352881C7